MTTVDVEATEPSDVPAPPGPLNQAVTADQEHRATVRRAGESA
ncbi:hypothetical protein [Streptomyces sp. NPDC001500]